MKIADAIRDRHSCRAFLDRPVATDKIEDILRLAACSPSGANTQPWQVAVVSGRTKQAIGRRMEAEFRSGNRGRPDYPYYPTHWGEPYESRRIACGLKLYSTLGIERADKEGRKEQWIGNYHAFGAPVVLYFFIASHLQVGSYLDIGMFLQSLMLSAQEAGLATCPQQSLAEYPDIVRQELGMGADWVLLCGMALGYEDTNATVNRYRTPRAGLEEFVAFYS